MGEIPVGEVTRLLRELSVSGADPQEATDRLFMILYGELHRIAENLMRHERPGHTLQPTALVNEAYLKLIGRVGIDWQSRAHFLRAAARAMRQVLVDYARRQAAFKRGGQHQRVTLDVDLVGKKSPEIEILVLDGALAGLSAVDQRMGQVVELRIFGGMRMAEIAQTLGVSKRTADSDWHFAKRWLGREIARAAP